MTTLLMVTLRSSPRGSRGKIVRHLDNGGQRPACGARTATAASVVPVEYDKPRMALLDITCTRCWQRLDKAMA
jgi:hypothetical protein